MLFGVSSIVSPIKKNIWIMISKSKLQMIKHNHHKEVIILIDLVFVGQQILSSMTLLLIATENSGFHFEGEGKLR